MVEVLRALIGDYAANADSVWRVHTAYFHRATWDYTEQAARQNLDRIRYPMTAIFQDRMRESAPVAHVDGGHAAYIDGHVRFLRIQPTQLFGYYSPSHEQANGSFDDPMYFFRYADDNP